MNYNSTSGDLTNKDDKIKPSQKDNKFFSNIYYNLCFNAVLFHIFEADNNDNLRSFNFWIWNQKKKKNEVWNSWMNFNSSIVFIMAHKEYEGSSYQDNLNLLIKIGTLSIILNSFSEFYLSFFIQYLKFNPSLWPWTRTTQW